MVIASAEMGVGWGWVCRGGGAAGYDTGGGG